MRQVAQRELAITYQDAARLNPRTTNPGPIRKNRLSRSPRRSADLALPIRSWLTRTTA